IWREQLKRIIEEAQRPNVTIQVLLAEVGAHPGIEGSFTVMDWPPEFVDDPGAIYLESQVDGRFLEREQDIKVYRNALANLQKLALTPEESIEWIDRLARESVA
uniref:DUF5753 domain-containing protein n=1 Tax=Amycolatopsis sp. CA-290885 TaxID=3239925 RepID=UPI003F494B5A